MDDIERLNAPIGDIYNAPLDRSLWLDVLEKIAGFFESPAAMLFAKESVNGEG